MLNHICYSSGTRYCHRSTDIPIIYQHFVKIIYAAIIGSDFLGAEEVHVVKVARQPALVGGVFQSQLLDAKE
jgi:hypothetical protein